MKAKTLKELNEKVWYRFVKLVFVLGMGLIAILAVGITWSLNQPRTIEDYRITCNYGNKSSYIAYERDIFIYDFEPYEGLARLPDYVKEKMSAECGNTQVDLFALADLIRADQPHDPLYTVQKEQYTDGNWFRTVAYTLLVLIIVVLIFEFIRRCFYYVVFGTIRPVKQ